ncbi:hypothetical protein GOBAR_DD07067 [Gossypium barbadense]|nr:hypothetical protein GOBAR_DD07067 [Gossypium barbadense]
MEDILIITGINMGRLPIRYWTVSYRFAPDINRWQAEALFAIQEVFYSCNSRVMARLPLIAQSVRRKRIGIALTIWLEICKIASWFLLTLGAIDSLHTCRPRIRSYILDFYAQRDYVKKLVHASDETCIEQVRMNRFAFSKLCEMLQTLGGLKSSRHMLVDEQVAMFLHIISHHLKNRVIKHHFNRSGETVSRSFHSVLNAVIRLQDVLFKKAEPITANSSDRRWKWFKNCLGALDGTHIKIRVPRVDKPRYRMQKGDTATNVLGVCTHEMQFVYVLPGWEGFVADGRVLRDAISRRHGLKVPYGCYYLVDAGYTNCEGFLAPFRGQRYHLNEWHQGYQPSVSESNVPSQSSRGTKRKWVPEEDVTLVSCMVDLHNVGIFNADTGFKAGYLNELEKMLEKALPNAILKARPNIESRIRLLKRDWSIVYDMLNGQNNSGFGWDDHRQVVVAEDAVWDSYLKSHKEADINEERNEYYDCDANVSLEDMDVSATEPQPDRNQGGSSSSKRKKKNPDASGHFSSSVNDAATLLAENMRAIGEQISRSIASDVVVQQRSEEFQTIQEKTTNLYPTLCEIEGLTVDERFRALSKILDHSTEMLVFFSLPSDVLLEWVRRFLADH